MTSIQIVPARPDDVPVILELIRGLGEYERLSDEIVATEDGLRKWLFGERPAAEVVLAYVDTTVAGFALFFHNFSTFLGRPGLYLEDLFVRPEARGKGIGRELLEYLANLTMTRGWARLEWRVLDWNEPSIAFYKKLGAEPLDDWTVFRVTGAALKKLAG